ncbi:MAG: CDP-alcohol phosphatidyltransferase family protein [Alphaproteobacteria bacterium]|nr:MAG: CDP-alcohol phosphatidyltransferase family protein [Alphaproteobacteria bacterium]
MPIILLFMAYQRYDWAMALFISASLTDWFDGAIARTFNQQTKLGAYLDPVADKIMMVALYGHFTFMGIIPCALTILVIGRDLAIVITVLMIKMHPRLGTIRISPHWVSKANTALQLFYLLIVFLHLVHENRIPSSTLPAVGTMVAITTVFSAAIYLHQVTRLRKQS